MFSALEIFLVMRYINLLFTYLLTFTNGQLSCFQDHRDHFRHPVTRAPPFIPAIYELCTSIVHALNKHGVFICENYTVTRVCMSQLIMRCILFVLWLPCIAALGELDQVVHTESEDCSFLSICFDAELRQLGIIPRCNHVQLHQLPVDVR